MQSSQPAVPEPSSGLSEAVEAVPGGETTIASLLSALFGGGLVKAWFMQRSSRTREKRDSVVDDIRTAQERLAELRALLRKQSADADAVADEDLVAAEQAFDTSYYRVGCSTVQDNCREYVKIARLWVSGDPETGVGAEEEAYHRAATALAGELERRR